MERELDFSARCFFSLFIYSNSYWYCETDSKLEHDQVSCPIKGEIFSERITDKETDLIKIIPEISGYF